MMNNIYKDRILYVSPYYPRECGIANYTKDLISALGDTGKVITDVVAINNSQDTFDYSEEVKFKIQSDDSASYHRMTELINNSDYDYVHLQHEFGLYDGDDGEYILSIAERLSKPLVVTFHTVLSNPNQNKIDIVKKLGNKASIIIVMADEAIRRLTDIYGLSTKKIIKIPHGVPIVPEKKDQAIRQLLNPCNRKILSTFGLISANKGIEYVIDAMKDISKAAPETLYLVIGKTHPSVLRQYGETYREMLEQKIKEYGIGDNVQFINKYLNISDLINYLQITDIYLTPYLEPQQITSGTLAYALGAGKACISTPYAYAKEVLANDRGCLVPFRDSLAIANKVITLLNNPALLDQYSHDSYQYSRNMLWSNIARLHLGIGKKL